MVYVNETDIYLKKNLEKNFQKHFNVLKGTCSVHRGR